MSGTKKLTSDDVRKLAQLANLPLTDEQLEKYPEQLTESLAYVENLKEIDTETISELAYTIDIKNVTREDEIDMSRVFTQKQALSNAKNVKNGKFVVKRIL
jgi:aspartyl-tRNA(Asn)/glutamyl-tRNA(Gln) amidotransferase subunit C